MDTVVKLLPALLGIALGYVLRLRGVAEDRDADFLFRLISTSSCRPWRSRPCPG